MRFAPLVRTLAAIGVVLSPVVAHAQWTPNGLIICNATGSQRLPSVAADGSGGCFVAWQDQRAASTQIYAQHLDAVGNVLWAANGVNVCSASVYQSNALVISDGAGGCIVVWGDARASFGSTPLGYAQRLNASGVPQWTAAGVPLTTGTATQLSQVITPDGAGGVIASWLDARAGSSNRDVFAQRLNASGAPLWGAAGLDVCQHPSNTFSPGGVVSDGAGGAIVGWIDLRNSKVQVYARRVDAAGDTLWSPLGVAVAPTATSQTNLQMSADGAGGAYCAFLDLTNHVVVQRVDGSGATVTGWPAAGRDLGVVNTSQFWDGLVTDGTSGAIATFQGVASGVGDIGAAHLTPGGTNDWRQDIKPPFYDNATTRAVSDGSGGVIVPWTTSDLTNGDAYAIRITSAGAAPGWLPLGDTLSTASGHQGITAATGDGRGGAFVVWEDTRNSATTGTDIAITKIANDGTTAVGDPASPERLTLADAGANPSPGSLVVRFSLPDDRAAKLALYDVAGRLEFSRDVGTLGAGSHVLRIVTARALAPGVYLARLSHGGEVRGVRLVVI